MRTYKELEEMLDSWGVFNFEVDYLVLSDWLQDHGEIEWSDWVKWVAFHDFRYNTSKTTKKHWKGFRDWFSTAHHGGQPLVDLYEIWKEWARKYYKEAL